MPGVPDIELFARMADVARMAEQSGFDSIWAMDHLHQIDTVGSRDEPILEAYTFLAAIAAVTKTARLGVLATACGFRNAALLAKMVTTIDIVSSGRAVLGIGAGWHEDEHHAYGIPFPKNRDRLRGLAEAVQVCRSMFTQESTTFAGASIQVTDALNIPLPVDPAGPPILIAGGGERVTIPLVARYGDAANFFGAPATVRHKISVLERACHALGRDSADITITWLGHAVIADSERGAHAELDRLGRLFGQAPQAARGFALCGTEEQVLAQLDEYLEVGVDGFIVTLLDHGDTEYVRRVGEVLGGRLHS